MSVELEPAPDNFKPVIDRRPRVPEPLPVKLVAVEDCRLPAPAGVEVQLDRFYVGLWGFERVESELAYRAENFLLSFDLFERPVEHESLRPLGIEVPSIADAERKLVDEKIDYVRQRGVNAGAETLLVRDPAGNWVELLETRAIA